MYRHCLQAVGTGVVVGATVSIAHFVLERLGFEGFTLLEARGICRRFIPDNKRQLLQHPEGNLLTVFLPYVILGTAVARCWFGDMATRMEVHRPLQATNMLIICCVLQN